MSTPYAARGPSPTTRTLWGAAAVAGAGYGTFVVVALRLPVGSELTGQFWPSLVSDGMAVPVTLYMAVLAAMVCAAVLARLLTPWTALGAVCFAVSDAMIGIGRIVLRSEGLAVPIWWAYATSLLLITAGLFFGRGPAPVDDETSAASATPSA